MKPTPVLLTDKISRRLRAAKESFHDKHSHAQEFLQDKGLDLDKIRQHSTKLLTAGTLAGAMLIGSPGENLQLQAPELVRELVSNLTDAGSAVVEDPKKSLLSEFKRILPEKVRPLARDEEKNIGLLIEKATGIRARATLEGEHLNTSYGLIGAEQHLPRFPGDTVAGHDEYQRSGVTPGRGAWGYFAYSRNQLTKEDILREKYYVAVQTLYLSDWEKRLPYLVSWYKYRKVIVVNTVNGEAVVAVVADAGPAAWTGKHFGGSPEVMAHLKLNVGKQKGPVLLFFVDDPDNKVPLGPVDYGKIDLPKIPIAAM